MSTETPAIIENQLFEAEKVIYLRTDLDTDHTQHYMEPSKLFLSGPIKTMASYLLNVTMSPIRRILPTTCVTSAVTQRVASLTSSPRTVNSVVDAFDIRRQEIPDRTVKTNVSQERAQNRTLWYTTRYLSLVCYTFMP